MALLELLAIPCALGVLLMGAIITRETWIGGCKWK
jgi:hypothetical protein